MSLEQQLRQAVHHVADRTPVPEVDLDAVRARARTNWRPRVAVAVIAAVVVIILAATSLLIGRGGGKPEPLGPVKPPGILVGAVPVWYDAAGLHRGDVVEKTPVTLFTDIERPQTRNFGGVLALVRGGALYRDPTNDEVWFHPWGGEPRVVGHDSPAGPGGDPGGDVAAWFDGEELVVYDTARGRELSRTKPGDDGFVVLRDARVVEGAETEHVTGGNGFKHVSAEEVVWRASDEMGLERMYRLDLSTGKSTIMRDQAEEGESPGLQDVHGATRLWGDRGGRTTKEALRIEVTGREELRLEVEPLGKLSADGSFVLTATCPARCAPHGAAIADVRSGEIWNLPYPDFYATIAWSYGDLAMVEVDQKPGREDGKSLVACNAATRQCHQLPRQGNVLLPTS